MYHKTFTNTFRLITLLAMLVGLLAVPGVTLANDDSACALPNLSSADYAFYQCGVNHTAPPPRPLRPTRPRMTNHLSVPSLCICLSP